MRMCAGLTKRNILVYFKDKQSVVFSVLTSIIVFALYLLFLKGTFVDAIDSVVSGVPLLKARISDADLDTLTNITLLVGILGTAMITVPFNCLTTVVSDRENNVDQDILATPVSRGQIILSYFLASSISAILMTGFIMTVGLITLRISGDLHMKAGSVLGAYLVIILGCVSSTALFMNIVLFFKTSSASGAFFGILSAVAGFVIGAYIPISQFSESVQSVCNVFPASHTTMLLRNTLMNGILDHIDSNIGGVDGGLFVNSVRDVYTFNACMFGKNVDVKGMILYILFIAVISIVSMIILYSKKYKR
ncbi:MAG: ABC transporter permease [Lachnospiraceae bacterium]|nr:ABC transporter permease [Lachnospiraceae bacterium]